MSLGRRFKVDYGIHLEDGWSLVHAAGKCGSPIVTLRFERLVSCTPEEMTARLDVGKRALMDPGPPVPPGLLRRVSFDLARCVEL